MTKTIAVSGGFDPLHVGHLRMFNEAAACGNVVVILNSDDWLRRKKGYAFMPWGQRAEIISGLRAVSRVEPVQDDDGTVCEALRRIRPDFFGNGGDRGADNTPEAQLCAALGIEPVFGFGGAKLASSSDIVAQASHGRVDRAWGHYVTVASGQGYKVKVLTFTGGKTRHQRHEHRSEEWSPLEGEVVTHAGPMRAGEVMKIAAGDWHWCGGTGRVLEIQRGPYCGEDDIQVTE